MTSLFLLIKLRFIHPITDFALLTIFLMRIFHCKFSVIFNEKDSKKIIKKIEKSQKIENKIKKI